MNPAGELTPASARKGNFQTWRLSPDEKRVLVWAEGKLNVLDLERDTLRRLNRNDSYHLASFVWSPDGAWIVFSTEEQGIQKVWRKRADWSAEEELLFEQEGAPWHPLTFSPDSNFLMGSHRLPDRDAGLWIYKIGGNEPPKPFGEPTGKISPRISPDGRLLSYLSVESGRTELFVRPFRGTGGDQQVSTHGAVRSEWSPDGKSIIYSGSRSNASELIQAPIEYKESSLQLGAPRKFAQLPKGIARNWAISSDGKRILIFPQAPGADSSAETLKVIFNWTSELERKAPLGRRQ